MYKLFNLQIVNWFKIKLKITKSSKKETETSVQNPLYARTYVTIESFIWTRASDERLPIIIEFIIAADLTNAAGSKNQNNSLRNSRAACEISVKYLSLGPGVRAQIISVNSRLPGGCTCMRPHFITRNAHLRHVSFPVADENWICRGRLREDVSHGITRSTNAQHSVYA